MSVELYDSDGLRRLGFVSAAGEWVLADQWEPPASYPVVASDPDEDAP